MGMDTYTDPTSAKGAPFLAGKGHEERRPVNPEPVREPRWLAWTRANNVAKELAR
jgi:hypothetical protein